MEEFQVYLAVFLYCFCQRSYIFAHNNISVCHHLCKISSQIPDNALSPQFT